MKRSSFSLPLTLALLFGLALIVTGSPAAYGDNLTACQGTGSSSASVTLAGRSIVPATLLRAANNQGCGNNESALKLVSLNRTLIVSPVGTASQNGQVLLTAMTTISNASPSITNPWLLKLEPGSYDLGGGNLHLQPYVDLEGSGEGTTTILAYMNSQNSDPAAVIYLAANSEVRFVKVVNNAIGGFKAAFYADSNVTNSRLVHVTTELTNNTQNGYALYNLQGSVNILDSTMHSTGGGSITVYVIGGSAKTDIRNSLISSTGSGSGNFAYGLSAGSSKVTIENSTVNVDSAGSEGIHSNYATITLQNSSVTANTTGGYSDGINSSGGTLTVQNSVISSTASSGYGMEVSDSTVQVGASQLSGPSGASKVTNGSAVCAASYNGKFISLTTACVG